MSNPPISTASTVPCPKCGLVLPIIRNQNEVSCSCGFSAFAPYVLEAHYLRTGLPAWQARLAELDSAIEQGLRPEKLPLAPQSSSPKKSIGAYQYLVGGGALLLFAGLAAFVGIMWKVLGVPGQAAVLVTITLTLMVVAIRLASRIATTSKAFSFLAIGSWLINLGWLINQIGVESKVISHLTIHALYSVVTAVVFTFAGRRFANQVWLFVGHLAIPTSLGLVLTSITLNLNDVTRVSSAQLAALALPLTIAIVLLSNQSVVTQFQVSSLDRIISLVVLNGFTVGFLIASFVRDPHAGLVWSIHFVALALFAASRRGSEFLAPYLAIVAIGFALEYALTEFNLSIWLISASVLPLSLVQVYLLAHWENTSKFFPSKSKLIYSIVNLSVVFHYAAGSFYHAFDSANIDRSTLIDPDPFYAWAVHVAIVLGVCLILKWANFLVPFLVAVIAVLAAGFTDLPIWVRALAPLVLSGLSIRQQQHSVRYRAPILTSLVSTFWILVAFATAEHNIVRYPSIAVSAVTGFVILILASKHLQAPYVLFAAPMLVASIVLLNQQLGSNLLERLTVPIGVALLICGALAFSIDKTIASLAWLAPGSGIGIIPSIVKATFEQDYSLRFIASVSVAVILLVVGARLRFLGALVIGLAVIVIAVRNPLVFVFNAVPNWLTFTVSGLLLLLVGARFEHLRKRAGTAKEWLVGTLR